MKLFSQEEKRSVIEFVVSVFISQHTIHLRCQLNIYEDLRVIVV